MNGIFVLDKPQGLSSQQAVTRVKRILGAKKSGHGGTLDPDATGVLPIYLNQATRLSEYALGGGKEYWAEATFGFSTDTQDASGKVLEVGDPSGLTEQRIAEALARFVGTYEQVPPQYSALKIGGKPAYALARLGVEVELSPRLVTIEDIRMVEIDRDSLVLRARFFVSCSKGTYIRTLCHDLGRHLGVPAHMSALRRTKSGPFAIEQAHTMAELEEQGWSLVLPPELGIEGLPMVRFDDLLVEKLRYGQTVCIDSGDATVDLPVVWESEVVRVHDRSERLVAICGVYVHGEDRIDFRPQKVFQV